MLRAILAAELLRQWLKTYMTVAAMVGWALESERLEDGIEISEEGLAVAQSVWWFSEASHSTSC